MYEYYFTFRSMTAAQQAASEATRSGYDVNYLRAPRALSALGCGYAIRVKKTDIRPIAAKLKATGIRYDKIMSLDEGGSRKEIRL